MVCRTGADKNFKFESNCKCDSNILILQFCLFVCFFLQDRGGQKSQIWAKFSTSLKFWDFCKNSCFSGPGQTKITNLSRILNVTQITWFRPISCFVGPGCSKISFLGKTLNTTQISWFCQISCFAGPGRTKSQIWILFLTRLKYPNFAKFHILQEVFNGPQISWFCQISCFAGPGWSKISNLSKIFKMIQISWFCQISCVAVLWWSKFSNLKKNFQHDQGI